MANGRENWEDKFRKEGEEISQDEGYSGKEGMMQSVRYVVLGGALVIATTLGSCAAIVYNLWDKN